MLWLSCNFVPLHWMEVFGQLCIDKCHENEWNVDTLLRDPVLDQ